MILVVTYEWEKKIIFKKIKMSVTSIKNKFLKPFITSRSKKAFFLIEWHVTHVS